MRLFFAIGSCTAALVMTCAVLLPACGGGGGSGAQAGDAASGDDASTGADSEADGSPADGTSGGGDASDGGPGTGPNPDAASFTLDPTFGEGGVTRVNLASPGPTDVRAMAQQADGKVLIAGSLVSALLVERFGTDGTLDSSFATGGRWILPRGDGFTDGALLVQPDQKIVVVGTYTPLGATTSTILVARLDASGNLDPSFGSGGLATAPGFAWTAILQTDGAIVAGGTAADGGYLVARFLGTGVLDTTFGTGGIAKGHVSGSTNDAQVFALAEQADGKLVIGGPDYIGSSFPLFIGRLTAAGAVDSTFGSSGFVTAFPTSTSASVVNSIAVQGDGKIVVAGGVVDGGILSSFAVGRYATNGTPDATFGNGSSSSGTSGWYIASGTGGAGSLTVQPDGKIATGGCIVNACGVARLTASGAMDATFGNNGFAGVTALASGSATAVEQPSGSYLVAGQTSSSSNDPFSLVLAKLTPAGALDTTYGTAGEVTTTPAKGSSDQACAGALLPGGGAVLVGSSSAAPTGLVQVTSAGVASSPFLAPAPSQPDSVVVQSTGGIVVATHHASNGYVAARYHQGAIDPSFGSGGYYADGTLQGGSIALGSGDAIVVAGSPYQPGFVVEKLSAGGQLDPSFGSAGRVTTAASVFGGAAASPGAVVVAADGTIAVAGSVDKRVGLARYTPAGALDATFGAAGVMTVDLGAPASAYALGVQTDGKLVLAAQQVNADGTSDLVVGRLTKAGAPDPAFGLAGLTREPLGQVDQNSRGPFPVGLAIGPDGRVYACSARSADGLLEHMLVLRLDSAGAVDARSVLPISEGNDAAHAVALQADGRVLLFGSAWRPDTGFDFAEVRLLPPP